MGLSAIDEGDTPQSTPYQSPARTSHTKESGDEDAEIYASATSGLRGTHGSDDTDWISYSEKGSSRTSGTSGSDTSSKLDRHAISVRGRLIEEGAAEDSENDDATRRKERNSSIGDVQHAIASEKRVHKVHVTLVLPRSMVCASGSYAGSMDDSDWN